MLTDEMKDAVLKAEQEALSKYAYQGPSANWLDYFAERFLSALPKPDGWSCPACDGSPSGKNVPCYVCGQDSPPKVDTALKPELVGVTAELPGTGGGFSQCCFKSADVPIGTPLFTAPQDTAAIEQRVAEACAKVIRSEGIGFADDDEELNRIAALIDSGKWREFL